MGRVQTAVRLGALLFATCLQSTSVSAQPSAAGVQGYQGFCAPCHGLNGQGNGPWTRELRGSAPRDFTRGLFQFRSSEDRVRVEDLVRTTLRGMPGTEMPAFRGLLTASQAAEIAEVVLSFSDRGRTEPPGAPLEIPPPPANREDSAAAGKQLYAENCLGCHGPSGRGDGKRAAELLDAWKAPIRPTDLVGGEFQGGSSGEELYRTLATGMEGIPMPPYGFLLEEEELWHLVHFVESIREAPGTRPFWRSRPLDPTRVRAPGPRKRQASGN